MNFKKLLLHNLSKPINFRVSVSNIQNKLKQVRNYNITTLFYLEIRREFEASGEYKTFKNHTETLEKVGNISMGNYVLGEKRRRIALPGNKVEFILDNDENKGKELVVT